MKKSLLVLIGLLSACAIREEKFVNPMFYKTMEPISKMVWQTTLTPTTMHVDNGYGYSETGRCKLLENTQTKIVMHCIRPSHQDEINLIYGFELLYPIKNNRLKVLQTYWGQGEEDYVARSYLYIDTSKEAE